MRRALLIGMATSTVAPARLGEAARAWIIARRIGGTEQNVALVVGTVLSQTLFNLLALSILALIALGGAHVVGARIGSVVAAIAIPALMVGLLLVAPRALRHAPGPSHARLARLTAWVSAQLIGLQRGFSVLRSRRLAVHALAAQLTAWALQLGTCYTVMLALHLDRQATLASAAAVLLAINITAIVPATPSNVGVFQAACVAVLARFGVPASKGLAYGIVLQAVEVISALGLGLPALLREGLSWSDLHTQIRRDGREG